LKETNSQRRTPARSVRAGDNHDMDLAPPTGSYLTRRWARGPLSVHSDWGTLSYKTRTKALRNGNHRPRARTPADRSRTSAGQTWASTSGSRTSRRPESSSQPGASLGTSASRSGRGPEPPRAHVGAAADPRVRCRHVSHRRGPPDLRSPIGQGSGAATSPCGRGRRPLGPVPPRVPHARVFRVKPALLPH